LDLNEKTNDRYRSSDNSQLVNYDFNEDIKKSTDSVAILPSIPQNLSSSQLEYEALVNNNKGFSREKKDIYLKLYNRQTVRESFEELKSNKITKLDFFDALSDLTQLL